MKIRYLLLGATCALTFVAAARAQPIAGGWATGSTTGAKPSTVTAASGPGVKGVAKLPASQTLAGGGHSVTAADVRATGMGGPSGLNTNNGGRAGVREDGGETEGYDPNMDAGGVQHADGSSETVGPNGSPRQDLTPTSSQPAASDTPVKDAVGHAWSAVSTALGGDERFEEDRSHGKGEAGVRGTQDERPTFGTNTLKGPPSGGAGGGDPKDTGGGFGSHGVSAANGGTVNLGNRAGGDAGLKTPKPAEAFNGAKLLNGASDPTRH